MIISLDVCYMSNDKSIISQVLEFKNLGYGQK